MKGAARAGCGGWVIMVGDHQCRFIRTTSYAYVTKPLGGPEHISHRPHGNSLRWCWGGLCWRCCCVFVLLLPLCVWCLNTTFLWSCVCREWWGKARGVLIWVAAVAADGDGLLGRGVLAAWRSVCLCVRVRVWHVLCWGFCSTTCRMPQRARGGERCPFFCTDASVAHISTAQQREITFWLIAEGRV
jgi:hypothetical protein